MKKYLCLINLIVPIISFILLFFFNYSEQIIYIMIMTLFIGWIIPYISLIITGASIINNNHHKLTLIFNIFTSLLNVILLFLIIAIYEKTLLIMLIEYSIFLIINIINIIYYLKLLKKENIIKKEEYKQIKAIKEKNNGIIK